MYLREKFGQKLKHSNFDVFDENESICGFDKHYLSTQKFMEIPVFARYGDKNNKIYWHCYLSASLTFSFNFYALLFQNDT